MNVFKTKSGSILGLIVHGCCIFLFSTSSSASELEMSLASGKSYFNYAEYDTTGEELDREFGWLTFLEVALQNRLDHTSTINGFVEYQIGKIAYDGHLQTGEPATTDTAEKVLYVGGEYLYQTGSDSQLGFQLSRGVWKRDIQASDIASNLYEKYTWHNLSIIQRVHFNQFNVQFLAGKIFSAKMDVDHTRQNLGWVEIPLRDGYQFQLKGDYITPWLSQWNSKLFFQYTYRKMPRSLPVTAGIYSIHEPTSQLDQLSLGLQLDWSL